MERKNVLNYIPILFSLLVLTLVLPLALWQVNNPQNKQELRGKAAEPTPIPINSLLFSPATGSVTVSATILPKMPIDLQFYTPTTPGNLGITGIKAVFTFDNSILTLTDSDITLNPSLYNSDPLSPAKWSITKTLTPSGTTTRVIVQGYNSYPSTDGWKGAVTSPQTFVTLNFSTKTISQNSVTTNLTFDRSTDVRGSAIYAKLDNSNIISFPVPGSSYTLYLDTVAPDTIITSGCPTSPLRNPTVTFVYAGNDTRNDGTVGTPTSTLTYAYQLDGGTWSSFSASTTTTLNNLSPGAHTFLVKAQDLLANIDATPASCTFSYTPLTNLNLKLLFQGLSPLASPTPLHYPKTISVIVRNSSGYNSGPLTASATYNSTSGYYVSNLPMPGTFPGAGTYEVLVKGPWHLRRNLGTTIININTDNLLERNSEIYKLLRGDITNDNFIALDDITAIIYPWTQSKVPVTSENLRKYDITEDGVIDIFDINSILSNWTVSEREGDK